VDHVNCHPLHTFSNSTELIAGNIISNVAQFIKEFPASLSAISAVGVKPRDKKALKG
jgi:hypothetical protein